MNEPKKHQSWLVRLPNVAVGAFLLLLAFPIVVPICASLAYVPVSAGVVGTAVAVDGKRRKLRFLVIVIRILISLTIAILMFGIGVFVYNRIGKDPNSW